ncbi:MAG: roadblock/LC7 domain-containing protein [Candidatus Helarchaeota archaeon]
MKIGRNEALTKLLADLSNELGASACILVDERGLLISEYLKNGLDKKAMAIMSSLINGTGNKFIDALEIQKLNLIKIETSKGFFLIKEIPLIEKGRKFILCVFINNKSKETNLFFENFLDFFRNYFTIIIDFFLFNKAINSHGQYNKQLDKIAQKIRKLFLQ